MSNQFNSDVIEYAINQLKDGVGMDCYGTDLHHELFNTDYFIIGYHESEKWIEKNVGVFKAINDIITYEKDNFGETNTDVSSSEKVCNMWVYIEGENILNEIEHLRECWDRRLDDEDIATIIEQLGEL